MLAQVGAEKHYTYCMATHFGLWKGLKTKYTTLTQTLEYPPYQCPVFTVSASKA